MTLVRGKLIIRKGDVMDSILNSVKKQLNVSIGDTSFDQEIIIYINSTLARLNQLGVGSDTGMAISDEDDDWSSILNNEMRFNQVKQYVYLKVKLVFDPPAVSAVLESIKQVIAELEFSIQVAVEEIQKEEVLSQ